MKVIEDKIISSGEIGVEFRDEPIVTLRRLTIQTPTAIRIIGNCELITIEDVLIEGFSRFGILIYGGLNRAPVVRIKNVTLVDPKPGFPTLPIAIYRPPIGIKPVRDLQMENVTVIGPGTPAIRERKRSDNPDNSTSDQVVLHGVNGAVLRNVRSLLGGENGISITRGSTNVHLIDCVANHCDGQGLHLGTHGYQGRINVIRGESIGNGRNQEGRTDGNFAGALCQSSEVVFEGWRTSGTERGIIAGKTANVKAIGCDLDCPIQTEAHAGARIEVLQ